MRLPPIMRPDEVYVVQREPSYDDELRGHTPDLTEEDAEIEGAGLGRLRIKVDAKDKNCEINSKGHRTGKVCDPCVSGCRIVENLDAGAYLVIESGNKKITAKHADCATTYASQETCPRTCPFLGNGCYGEGGMVMMAAMSCNESCKSQLDCAINERDAILAAVHEVDARPKGRLPFLRVHTVGDCRSIEAAGLIGEACDAWNEMHRSGKARIALPATTSPTWSYTHAWRTIPREVWGSMSIIASCNHIDEVKDAVAAGYRMVSLVVKAAFQDDDYDELDPFPAIVDEKTGGWKKKTYHLDHDGLSMRVHPCKAQVIKGETCATCRWCLQEHDYKGPVYHGDDVAVIVLAVHGADGVLPSAREVVADTGI